MAPCSGLLLVILHRHDEEDEECDSLDGSQEEEVVIQCALVDVTEVFRRGHPADDLERDDSK